MKIIPIVIALTAAVSLSCTGSNEDLEPELEINFDPATGINLCAQPVDETYFFGDIQLRNTGNAPVTVTRIAVRGNEDCSFRCLRESADFDEVGVSYPCEKEGNGDRIQMTIPAGAARLVALEFTPIAVDAHSKMALVISSDATSWEPLDGEEKTQVIPVCGTGAEPLPDNPMEDETDGGLPMDASVDSGSNVEPDCPACFETIPKDAPSCPQ